MKFVNFLRGIATAHRKITAMSRLLLILEKEYGLFSLIRNIVMFLENLSAIIVLNSYF